MSCKDPRRAALARSLARSPKPRALPRGPQRPSAGRARSLARQSPGLSPVGRKDPRRPRSLARAALQYTSSSSSGGRPPPVGFVNCAMFRRSSQSLYLSLALLIVACDRPRRDHRIRQRLHRGRQSQTRSTRSPCCTFAVIYFGTSGGARLLSVLMGAQSHTSFVGAEISLFYSRLSPRTLGSAFCCLSRG